jgi:uroporphyrinogen decarboxylase
MFKFRPDPDFSRLRRALLRQGEPDRVPFYELFADQEIVNAVADNMELVDPKYRRQVKAVQGRTVRYYYMLGYDYIPTFALVSLPRQNILSTTDTAGLSRGERMWVDEHHGEIETREDFEKYPWPSPSDIDYSLIENLRERLPDGMKVIGTTSGVLENVMWLMGYELLSYALYDNPDLVQDMFNKIGEILLAAHSTVAQMEWVGALALGDDMGFKTHTMISPQHLRKYVFPWQKKIAEAVHACDKPLILHSCGNLTEIMDDLIDYVGIDAKHSYEDVIMPVTEAKKRYGKRVSVLGGVDMNFLCQASPDAVRRYVRHVLDECAPGGGYCLGTGNSVANYIKLENYLTMLDEGLKY